MRLWFDVMRSLIEFLLNDCRLRLGTAPLGQRHRRSWIGAACVPELEKISISDHRLGKCFQRSIGELR